MAKHKRNSYLEADEEEIRKVFIKTAVKSIVYTILWIPVFLTRCFLVEFLKRFKPNYGKILDSCDSTVEEDYCDLHPKNSLVFTFVLDGPLTLQTFRQLFVNNVLEAKLKGVDKIRYPEFKQYQKDFAGFKFWKDDESFNISNHITEQSFNKKFSSMSKVHQEMINKKFPHRRSPWEFILVQNYQNDEGKVLLIYRCHHTLGDTKSCLKVLIENLGQKMLKLPNVQYHNESIFDKIKYYTLLPFYFVYVQVIDHFVSLKADKCYWKWKSENEPLLNLAISKKVSISEVKAIAKRNNTTASAVIMAAVAGGVAKSDRRLAKFDVPMQYILPRQGHPDTLANYSYSAVMDLPTNLSTPLDRLRKCNDLFLQAKGSLLHVYGKSVVFQLGTWFNPLRYNFLKNATFPLILTNIASDGDGFQIGTSPCSEFTMTCAPLPGACGIIICVFSYKDTLEVSATVKDGVLSEAQTHKLTDLIEKEFEILQKASV